jgi:SAM-dependent methyltransferase
MPDLRPSLVAAFLVAAVAVTVDAQSPAKPRARLFPPQDLGLFDAPDRDQWQKPELIMDDLSIADGSIVADLGAAPGWFAVRLARRVGPNGIVYAEDIQPEMMEALRRRIQNERLPNIVPILGTGTDPRLPRGIDAVLMVGVYAEVVDPVALLKTVARSLKPQGRIGIVDFNPGNGGPGPEAAERVAAETVIAEAQSAGLTLIKREPVPPFQFLLVFGKQR